MKIIRIVAFLFLSFPFLSVSLKAFAYEEVCHGPRDGLREKRIVVVPEGRQQEFIEYFRANGAGKVYSTGESSSEHDIALFLNTAGVYISVENVSPSRNFLFKIRTCNATENWRPHWKYVLGLADTFLKSNKNLSKPVAE